jgi:hypothetical protein
VYLLDENGEQVQLWPNYFATNAQPT